MFPSHTQQQQSKQQSRLIFLLACIDSSDACERAAAGAREVLASCAHSGDASKLAMHELLRGLPSCNKRAARTRLQLARELVEAGGACSARLIAGLVPSLVKQALACLSQHCRHDAPAAQALASFMGAVASRLTSSDDGDLGRGDDAATLSLAAPEYGRWLHSTLLAPLVRSAYRDPEPRRVSAGAAAVGAVLDALALRRERPAIAVALRAGLAEALEHMAAGPAARRVSAAYAPLGRWAAAVGCGRLGVDGVRRLAAICCRGAADRDAWQVRREALQTLSLLLGAVAAEPGSAALETLAAQRPRLLAALDACRHDAIPAVREAAGAARAAALQLPGPPLEGAAPAAMAGGLRADSAQPSARPHSGSPFKRPKAPPGALDFGVQVFAPPSPRARQPPAQQQQQQLTVDVRSSIDAAAQTSGDAAAWPGLGSALGPAPAAPACVGAAACTSPVRASTTAAAACASLPAHAPCAAALGEPRYPCIEQLLEQQPAAAAAASSSSSLSEALAAVRQANSRVGGLLQELSASTLAGAAAASLVTATEPNAGALRAQSAADDVTSPSLLDRAGSAGVGSSHAPATSIPQQQQQQQQQLDEPSARAIRQHQTNLPTAGVQPPSPRAPCDEAGLADDAAVGHEWGGGGGDDDGTDTADLLLALSWRLERLSRGLCGRHEAALAPALDGAGAGAPGGTAPTAGELVALRNELARHARAPLASSSGGGGGGAWSGGGAVAGPPCALAASSAGSEDANARNVLPPAALVMLQTRWDEAAAAAAAAAAADDEGKLARKHEFGPLHSSSRGGGSGASFSIAAGRFTCE